MRHVTPISLPFSARCAYFLSPQGCTLIPSALRRSPGPPPSPLKSTLAKVYQNKQLQLPLESSTYAKQGGGRGHCYLAAPDSSLCSAHRPPFVPAYPHRT